ncbi:MAG: hypothetical protein ABJC13_10720 [Acidobacteriota bacterium]
MFFEWLKSSVPGLILLGAMGSLLALAAVRLLGSLIERWFKPARTALLRVVRAPGSFGKTLGRVGSAKSVASMCALALAFFLFCVGCCFFGASMVFAGVFARPLVGQHASFLIFGGSLFYGFALGTGLFVFQLLYATANSCLDSDIEDATRIGSLLDRTLDAVQTSPGAPIGSAPHGQPDRDDQLENPGSS